MLHPMRHAPGILSHRVLPFTYEPLARYVARLAYLHGISSSGRFLREYASWISIADVMNGRAQREIAQLVDLPEDIFFYATPVREPGERVWKLNGTKFDDRFASSGLLRVCPQCLDEDLLHAPGRQSFRPHVRTWWQFEPVRACPIHGLELVSPGDQVDLVFPWRRFGRRDGQRGVAGPQPLVCTPAHEDEIGLSQFVIGRLGLASDFPDPDITSKLDLLPALKFFELVGSFATDPLFTGDVPPGKAFARRVGFGVLSRNNLDALLAAKLEAMRAFDRMPTPNELLADLNTWALANRNAENASDLIEALRTFASENLIINSRHKLFRDEGTKRSLKTVRQATQELSEKHEGVSRTLVSRILDHIDFGAPNYLDRAGGDYILGQSEIELVGKILDDRLPRDSLATFLNIPGWQITELIATGTLRPLVEIGASGMFSRTQLNWFVQELLGDSPPLTFAERSHVLLHKVGSASPDATISRAIIEIHRGALKPAGDLIATVGLPTIVLKTEDVKAIAGPSQDDPSAPVIGVRQLSRVLECPMSMAGRLLDAAGGLRSMRDTSRNTRATKTPRVSRAEIERFQDRFISLAELDRRLSMPRHEIIRRVVDIGGFGDGRTTPPFLPREKAEQMFALTTMPASRARLTSWTPPPDRKPRETRGFPSKTQLKLL